MSAIGNAIGLAWTIAAWWFVASAFAAPVFLAIRKARARGKRLFADEPTARVKALKSNTSGDHEWDGFQ